MSNDIQVFSVSTGTGKLDLVDEIWKSLSANADFLEVTQEGKDRLDTRWALFPGNPASALSIDEFKSKIQGLRA